MDQIQQIYWKQYKLWRITSSQKPKSLCLDVLLYTHHRLFFFPMACSMWHFTPYSLFYNVAVVSIEGHRKCVDNRVMITSDILYRLSCHSRSHWSRGLRRRSADARLLRLWVRISPGTWTFVVSVVRYRSLRRDDHSSRGILPTVVRRCV